MPDYTDAELERHCADVLGCYWKRGRKPHLWDFVIPGGINSIDWVERDDGSHPDHLPLRPSPLEDLGSAFRLATTSGIAFMLGGESALACRAGKSPIEVGHDGTEASAARALVVAVLKATGRIE